ncbi:TetR/AcrR family transcriptional regulator [Micromonospora sp. PPF5-17]|uniref:TetR/AcrR family transcriptional regulator n=2 Tax=Micromonosporaceae TaxID=28056 RepID=A0ABX9WKH3_9ACTN|nr:TetR/AcrR family transcriptional regulator [Micromonospora sp. PPF5-17B]NES35463.1 TetR/AcrR family transcriptional regulator [Micromonospora solifontis]NES55380.1 TetR/AcrR family transcriptional regulator [Micromonospora sp. PPF5-6]RNM00782.1 TetR/AcrR family transcriptional regulator [Micromonospora solifontis]
MSPEQRRAMIVRAALPLLVTQGATFTTAQVARAAGIGEATVFRAFADKDALLDACVAEALRPDTALAELASVGLDQPLANRLTAAATALRAHLERLGAVLAAAHSAGRPGRSRRNTRSHPDQDPTAARTRSDHGPGAAPSHPEHGPGEARTRPDHGPADARSGRAESTAAVRAAVAALLAPEQDRLRLPADRLAALFLAVLLPGRGPLPGDPPTPAELVDLFLHGALVTTTEEANR